MSTKDRGALVEYRMQEARESLEEARLLLDAGQSLRSVVNRTYYAMFYAALALQHRWALPATKHSGTIALFDREFVRTGLIGKEHSRALHSAFSLRQEEDYQPVVTIERDEAVQLLGKAEAFVAAVAEALERAGEGDA